MSDISLEAFVKQAQEGSRDALQQVLSHIKADVYSLAIKFLWDPHDAEDASQEILLKVLMHIGSFRGESKFTTWVYRVACNQLLALKKQRVEKQNINFEFMAEDLVAGLEETEYSVSSSPEYHKILDEIRIGCTLAMLQCLDRKSRLSYILGEIMAFEHTEASELLGISADVYRKRLSRSRDAITQFMLNYCGLIKAENNCRCHKRVTTAIKLNRVDPENLVFTDVTLPSSQLSQTIKKIRELKDVRRAVALYKTQPALKLDDRFSIWLKDILDTVVQA
jgi:RNA polymerase sigma factor (sigma-70 family)